MICSESDKVEFAETSGMSRTAKKEVRHSHSFGLFPSSEISPPPTGHARPSTPSTGYSVEESSIFNQTAFAGVFGKPPIETVASRRSAVDMSELTHPVYAPGGCVLRSAEDTQDRRGIVPPTPSQRPLLSKSERMAAVPIVWRRAASVFVVVPKSVSSLDTHDYEVCFVKRSTASRFLPGVSVFPGGKEEEGDRVIAKKLCSDRFEQLSSKICAARELAEETGLILSDPLRILSKQERQSVIDHVSDWNTITNRLLPLCRWISPDDFALAHMPRGGFDTDYFVTILPERPTLIPDDVEISEITWLSPSQALERKNELVLTMPQLFLLHDLLGCTSISTLPSFVDILRRGVYRYPLKARWIVLSPQSDCAFVMPGDYMHDQYRPRSGALWKHRAIPRKDPHGRLEVEFQRSSDLLETARASIDDEKGWCIHTSPANPRL